MSLGEQKEQKDGEGNEGGGSNTNWVGLWRDRSVLGWLLAFLLKPKKTKRGVRASHTEADDFQPWFQSVSIPLEC